MALRTKINDRERIIEQISTIAEVNAYYKGDSAKQEILDYVPLFLEHETLLKRLPSSY